MPMGLPEGHLYQNEQIVIDLHPHWWYLTPRALALVAAMVAGVWYLTWDPSNDSLHTGVGVVVGIALLATIVWFAIRYVSWRTTNFVVTTDRCIYRSGVVKKSGIEIPLERINTVFFNQTFFERLLGAGDLAIESAGEGSRQSFSDIRDPVQVQNLIYMQMEENENRKYSRIGEEARSVVASASSGLSPAEQLEKLASLLQQGVITQEEFDAQKRTLLG
jgi:uncharacterized membrane protein YdbT with pleckstrin-like domain